MSIPGYSRLFLRKSNFFNVEDSTENIGVLGSAVVSVPTIPKVCGSNPSEGTVGILASRPVRVWILSHLD